mmetsp:Transcript_19204/g.39170  ORF Transcript_19204/g.39170 Transcript_19204/m.39170 type:complete len:140 (-) Transcript_19204:1282-1701(-)
MSRKPKPVNTSAMEHDPSESAIYRQWLDLHARWCHPGDTKMREIVAYYQHLRLTLLLLRLFITPLSSRTGGSGSILLIMVIDGKDFLWASPSKTTSDPETYLEEFRFWPWALTQFCSVFNYWPSKGHPPPWEHPYVLDI